MRVSLPVLMVYRMRVFNRTSILEGRVLGTPRALQLAIASIPFQPNVLAAEQVYENCCDETICDKRNTRPCISKSATYLQEIGRAHV